MNFSRNINITLLLQWLIPIAAYAHYNDEDIAPGEAVLSCAEQVVGFKAPVGNDGGSPHYFKLNSASVEFTISGSTSRFYLPSFVTPMTCDGESFRLTAGARQTIVDFVDEQCKLAYVRIKAANIHYIPDCWDHDDGETIPEEVGSIVTIDDRTFGDAIADEVESRIAAKLPSIPTSISVDWNFRSFWDMLLKNTRGTVTYTYPNGMTKSVKSLHNDSWFKNLIQPDEAGWKAVGGNAYTQVAVPLFENSPNLCSLTRIDGNAFGYIGSTGLVGTSELWSIYNCGFIAPGFSFNTHLDVEYHSEWVGIRSNN